MIGWAAMHRFLVGDTDDYECDLKVRWDIEELGTVSNDHMEETSNRLSGVEGL